ncbi:hypothetical protein J6590_070861 [Homalodisca vitripennis]|nr:hypothetical protein J6590_070861 [Homalodisca vitripennis]
MLLRVQSRSCRCKVCYSRAQILSTRITVTHHTSTDYSGFQMTLRGADERADIDILFMSMDMDITRWVTSLSDSRIVREYLLLNHVCYTVCQVPLNIRINFVISGNTMIQNELFKIT